MKSLGWSLVTALVLIVTACTSENTPANTAAVSDQPAVSAPASTPSSYTGEIMDAACAAMGSHDAMMKQEGAKDAKECTLKCVAGGSKFVLYDAASKTTYQLDDQTKPKDFAGQKVKVTGTLDSSSNTIHVEGIAPA